MLKEFKTFVLRGNVVDLAVAVVIGAAFGAVVSSLVVNFVTPFIAALGGLPNFSTLKFTLRDSVFHYGLILDAIISFLSIAAVVFFFVVQPLNKLLSHVKPGEGIEAPAERECPECLSAIPAAAKRCKFCTAASEPVSQPAAEPANQPIQ
ncbi:large conductance mechanosensitive channel protein MscL [Candidatus Saccharibacteria bacterium]|nr:MAG: large conductance mechanosensitive channel protein MscL [Candidatus Saccharibacteria bacterium]PID98881.1 MAG: large conductance mechanosensitive channel protein MscL [Candidatus Saccharibacteria bacterium]